MNTLKFNQIEFNHIGEQPTSSIKLQEKSVTITENGTIQIVPDSGYALKKVEVKTDITNDPNSENYIEFFDYKTVEEYFGESYALLILNAICKWTDERIPDGICIGQYSNFNPENGNILLAIGLRPNFRETMSTIIGGEITHKVTTLKQMLGAVELYDTYLTMPRITKEEFYNLNV